MDIATIKQLAKEQEDYVIAQRRYLHENPEESDKEDKTCEHIVAQLADMGIDSINVPRGGVIAFVGDETKNNGKTILLRADIDALPIVESETNLNQKKIVVSKNHGVAHMCGHDGHTAMLLGAAKILKANEDKINGRILLMFERGEEGTENIIYIHKYFDDHNIRIDSSFGMHLMSYEKSGTINVMPGPMMAGAFKFEITIHGRGGHGSRPDMTRSPVDAFNSIYTALNTVRMRKVGPFDAFTFTVGSVQTSSDAQNVVPESIRFSGTARVFNHQEGRKFTAMFKDIVEHTCKMFECEPEFHKFDGPGYGVVNHHESSLLAEDVLAGIFGKENIVRAEPLMGSETFAYTQQLYPGVFGQLGIYNEEKGTGANHHTAEFDLDEAVFVDGVASHIAYALAWLNADIDVSDERYKGTLEEMYAASAVPKERLDAFE